ncbi:single-stranded DNA-binding protein [Liquorilactobacillus cacaonum]|uniref:single-stranded DNA-binding protein n=1 Tax=Liquorilactobacillus cacaonum TaxID=483012 RepID=UPI00070C35F9|nr:single-stranded DNA-binding protein [Liquorilactobacillus cacaonum]
MMNKATIIGRLTRDPDLKYTQSGIAVAAFTVAVNRRYTNQQGEREADFINCVIWRKAAEIFCNYTHKGSLVGVDGHLQTRSYDAQDGHKVFITELVIDEFDFLETKKQAEQNHDQISQNYVQNQAVDVFEANGQQIDISDEDLPF